MVDTVVEARSQGGKKLNVGYRLKIHWILAFTVVVAAALTILPVLAQCSPYRCVYGHGNLTAVELFNNLVAVVDGRDLVLLTAEDGSYPEVSRTCLGKPTIRLQSCGSYLCVNHWADGGTVVDVRDPHAPRVVFSTDGSLFDLLVHDDLVLVAFREGLSVWDMSSGELVASYPSIRLFSLTVFGKHLYGVSGQGLEVFDISDPKALRRENVVDANQNGRTHLMHSSDGEVYLLVDWDEKLQVFALDQPSLPRLMFSTAVDFHFGDTLAIDVSNCYIAGHHSFFRYHLENDGTFVKTLEMPLVEDGLDAIRVHGATLFGTSSYHGLFVIDLPSNPPPAESLVREPGASTGGVKRIFAGMVLGEGSQLVLYADEDPTSPITIDVEGGGIWGLTDSAPNLYVSSTQGLATLHLDASGAVESSSFQGWPSDFHQCIGLFVVGSDLLVGCDHANPNPTSQDEILRFDLSNPDRPAFKGSMGVPGQPTEFAIGEGGRIFALLFSQSIIEVSLGEGTMEYSEIAPTQGQYMSIWKNRAAVMTEDQVLVYDLDSGETVQRLAFPYFGTLWAFAGDGPLVTVAFNRVGLYFYEFHDGLLEAAGQFPVDDWVYSVGVGGGEFAWLGRYHGFSIWPLDPKSFQEARFVRASFQDIKKIEHLRDNLFVVMTHYDHIYVVRITPGGPECLRIISRLDGIFFDVEVIDARHVVVSDRGYVYQVDLTDPVHPDSQRQTNYLGIGAQLIVAVRDGLLAQSGSGLRYFAGNRVLGYSQQPLWTKDMPDCGNILDLGIEGDRLAVICSTQKGDQEWEYDVRLMSFSPGGPPAELHRYDLGANLLRTALAIDAGRMAVSTATGLRIIDIGDGDEISDFDTTGRAQYLRWFEADLFMAPLDGRGIEVFDVGHDPPAHVGSVPFDGVPSAFAISGSFVVAGLNGLGMDVVPLSDFADIMVTPSFHWEPAAPLAGESIVFVNETPCGDCTYRWSWGDGKTSSGRNVSHVFETAGSYTVMLTAQREGSDDARHTETVVVSDAVSGGVHSTFLMPGVANKKGLKGSDWHTSFAISNISGEMAQLSLSLSGAEKNILIDVPPNATWFAEDAARNLFGVDSYVGSLGVNVMGQTRPQDIVLHGVTYTVHDSKRFGQTLPVYPVDQRAYREFRGMLADRGRHRWNLLVVGEPGTELRIWGRDTYGGGEQAFYGAIIPEGGYFQLSDLWKTFLDKEFEGAWSGVLLGVEADHPVRGFVSWVDQQTNDPVMVPLFSRNPESKEAVTLVARTPGKESFWETDITSYNPGDDLVWKDTTMGNDGRVLAHGMTGGFSGEGVFQFTHYLRWWEDSAMADFKGTAIVLMTAEQPFQIFTKIYNQISERGFGYGQGISPPAPLNWIREGLTGYLNDLFETDSIRTNVGFLSIGSEGGSSVLLVEAFDANGTRIGERSVEIRPWELIQWNSVLKSRFDTEGGPVLLKITNLGGGRVAAYATRIFNGTSDPSFYWARVRGD